MSVRSALDSDSDASPGITSDKRGILKEDSTEAIPAKEIEVCSELLCTKPKKKAKFLLKNGRALAYVPPTNVENDVRRAACSDSAIARALSSNSDLVPHVYEGGLKVWECSVDLTEFLSTQDLKFVDQKVLELGCGSGLPGLFALVEGAVVHFQDYNEEVIRRLTIPNVALNVDQNKLETCRFFSGDWESLGKLLQENTDDRYDMILTSETIYSPESYKKLHDVMVTTLKPDGVVYLAAKTCYFGVGGGTRDFEDYVLTEAKFDVLVVKEFKTGVKREILKLTWKNHPD